MKQKLISRFYIFSRSFRFDYSLYLMMIPGICYYVLFHYIPMYGVTIAFRDYNIYQGFSNAPWVGLQHFYKLFSNIMFLRALRNTVIISIAKHLIIFPIPIIFAILLNEIRSQKYKKTVQTLVCLPHFFSWVVTYSILYAILSPTKGIEQTVKNFLGIITPTANVFISKTAFRPLLILSSLWKGFGFGSIIYIATLAGIDPQLYEAAAVDGAGKWKTIFHITLPGLRTVIALQFILSMGSILDAGFEQVFVMYNPLVYEVADILGTYVYKLGIANRIYTLSTAAGVFQSVIGLIMVLSVNKLAKKFDPESGLI